MPPASKRYSHTNPVSCGLIARLAARQATPSTVKRRCRKHHTAIAHNPITTPAALPLTRMNSLLAANSPSKTPERNGASSAAQLQIATTPAMMQMLDNVSQTIRARWKGSAAIGAINTCMLGG